MVCVNSSCSILQWNLRFGHLHSRDINFDPDWEMLDCITFVSVTSIEGAPLIILDLSWSWGCGPPEWRFHFISKFKHVSEAVRTNFCIWPCLFYVQISSAQGAEMGGRGFPYEKGTGILVVLLRGANHRLWCWGWKAKYINLSKPF